MASVRREEETFRGWGRKVESFDDGEEDADREKSGELVR
jgi:hypothetical protein